MMKFRILSFLVALLICFQSGAVALAQDPTPEPGDDASEFLPDAEALGNGWTLSQIVSPDVTGGYYFEMSPDVFREGASGVYLGPDGARVIMIALLLTDSRVAVRQSWEDATGLFDMFRGTTDYDYEREEALESLDPPAGCVEAKRTEGADTIYMVPAGTTMCAIDPDIVLIVMVSGAVGELTGTEAADSITLSMIESGS
ncbi:hypothetical protein BH09CHL1_BH09CHL1_07630 [soil metagenome]